MSPEEFWSNVNKTDDCWLWTRSRQTMGYGQVWVDGRQVLAHRYAYESTHGPIPEGKVLDHRPTCPIICVRPDHLRVATDKQNGENRVGLNKNNKSGVRGVCWDSERGKWYVHVTHHGRLHNGGRYDDLDEAAAAARELRNRLFTHNELDRV